LGKLVNKKTWILVIIVAAVIGGILAYNSTRKSGPTYSTVKVDKGDIRSVVEATGTINAVTTVQVGSQVSGTISQLYADFNSKVKKGELVAQIDPSLFQGAVLQARANLENSHANLSAAQANLLKAQASAAQMNADYMRTQGLTKEGIFSQQQLDLAKANADSAKAAVSAAQAQVTQASAEVKQNQAALTVAETNLNHTRIIAPIDGTVVNRAVDVGQTVAASLQAPTLFTIAQDLTKMQVYMATDESDVGRIRVDQPVTFKVDAFPRDTFKGHVSQIRMNPTTVQNVVTYNTIIDFDNPDLKLLPGMTAYVTVPVAERQDVLKVPNAALRFKPDIAPDQVRSLYQKYGIQVNPRGGQNGGGQPGSITASNETQAQPAAKGQANAQHGGTRAGGNANTANSAARNQAPGAGAAPVQRADTNVVWKLAGKDQIVPVQIKTGITDYSSTELISGDLKEGDQVVTGQEGSKASASGAPGLSGAKGGRGPR
jgi:HlyD family secretion protein